jgi:hypothetical protein
VILVRCQRNAPMFIIQRSGGFWRTGSATRRYYSAIDMEKRDYAVSFLKLYFVLELIPLGRGRGVEYAAVQLLDSRCDTEVWKRDEQAGDTGDD